MEKNMLVELTANIVSAHVSNEKMSKEELLDEIQEVHGKLCSLAGVETAVEGSPETAADTVAPVVSLEEAFKDDKVYCMICGKGFLTLKKHLGISHSMTPKDYREKYSVPKSTPLVARNYSEAKRRIAQKLGLAEKLAEGRAKRKLG